MTRVSLAARRASDDVDPVNAGYRGLAEAEASLRGLQQKVNMLRMQLVTSSEAASAGEAATSSWPTPPLPQALQRRLLPA